MKRIQFGFAAVCLAFVLSGASASAATAEGAVAGTGHVVIKRQPQLLRAQFTINADGKDIAEAIANLKAAQADASKKLTDLGATPASLELGPMGTPSATDPRQQYIQQMMAQQGRKKPKAGPVVVSLTCTLKAEWPMKEGSQEEQLAAGYTLQEKIKATGIGKAAKKNLTPEEQEAFEEAAGMNGGAANSDEPSFIYVSKVSEDDRATAMADAFKKAKADAALLAKAADSQLGGLQKMTSSISAAPAFQDPQTMYMRAMMQQAGLPFAPSDDAPTDEATGAAPGPVELNVTVTATFDLGK